VTAATLQSIAVTPASPSIAKGRRSSSRRPGRIATAATAEPDSSVTWIRHDHGGDDHDGRPGDGRGSGNEQHHRQPERSDIAGGCVDGDGGDAAIDRGDAGESVDRQGATQQFTATGTYSDSSTQNLTAR
jgi:hypothetical protein